MYQLPYLRKQLLPTIPQAVQALERADQDDPILRDVRPLMAILAKMIQVIPRLAGLILRRRVALTACDWVLTPYDAADADQCRRAEQRQRKVAMKLLDWGTDAPLLGASGVELDWIPGQPAGTTPIIIRRAHATELEQNDADPLDIVLLSDDPVAMRTSMRNEPRQSWIIDAAEGALRGGTMRSLIYHELLIDDMIREEGSYNRKLKGIVQAVVAEHATPKDVATAADSLQKVAQHNYSVTTDAVKFVFNKVAEAGAGSSFAQLRSALERDRAIRILGEANTTELPDGGGSRAAVEVQERVNNAVAYSDMRRMEAILNEQLNLFDYQINVNPSATEVPWHWEVKSSDITDPEQQMRLVLDAKTLGLPLLASEVYQRIGFTMPEQGDATLFESGALNDESTNTAV